MTDQVTEADENKPIVDANGDRLGRVVGVEDGRALVEPADDASSIAVIVLGWAGDTGDDDTYPLMNSHVDTIGDEAIHLKSNL